MILIASRWGLLAVSLAFVARYYLLWPIRFRIVASLGGMSASALAMLFLRPAALALVMALAVMLVDRVLDFEVQVLRLIFAITVGLTVFGLGVITFMPDRLALLRRYMTRT